MNFFDKVKIIGKKTKYITIPDKICNALEIKKGNLLKINIEKYGDKK
jgi:DNA-binding Xre family transcriptional regulator